MYKEIDGDLIKLALEGEFDVIAQGCNCFCTQKKGIAVEFAKHFQTNEYWLESPEYKGDINKLGNLDCDVHFLDINGEKKELAVLNCYVQYNYAKRSDPPNTKYVDYGALLLCFKKINHLFKGKRIGLPKIGAGLAGGEWAIILAAIVSAFKDCDVTVINYKK